MVAEWYMPILTPIAYRKTAPNFSRQHLFPRKTSLGFQDRTTALFAYWQSIYL